MGRLQSWARIFFGFTLMGTVGMVWFFVMLPLLPWPRSRAHVSNVFARHLGAILLRLTGSDVEVHHKERLAKPAIFVSNHSSMVDILLAAWLVPNGTVGLGKREILRYPLIGALFFLSGSVAVHRGQRARNAEAIDALGQSLKDSNLGIFVWPEGTRSSDAEVGQFKRGFAQLALATGLDVVPIAVSGAWKAWPRKSIRLCPTTVRVDVLEPIPAASFAEGDGMDATIDQIRASVATALQHPPPRAANPRMLNAQPPGALGPPAATEPEPRDSPQWNRRRAV